MTRESDKSNFNDMRDQVVVVTGASRGLGRVYAETFARLGAHVVLIARNQQQLDEVTGAIRARGGEAVCMAADVTDRQAVDRAFAFVDSCYGHIDLLVNNAGCLGSTGLTWELDAEAWWNTLELHVRGGLYCIQQALRRMVPRGSGRIVTLASHAGVFRWPTLSAYSVAKAALIKLTENVAVETRKHGVVLFAFHPGIVRDVGLLSDMQAAGSTRQEMVDTLAWLSGQVAEGRSVTAEQGADALVQLVSGRYDFLNGRYVTVYDDLDLLSEQADQIRRGDAFTLRLARGEEAVPSPRRVAVANEEMAAISPSMKSWVC
jgi:NAD(P)-dependent dehydrogenase (short-subunit alcohol dehydrogenase family)